MTEMTPSGFHWVRKRANVRYRRAVSGRTFGTAVPASQSIACQQVRGVAAHGLTIVRTAMRISARNQIKGAVVEVKKGATTSHVRVDIGGGNIMTSAITNEAVDDLGIKTGGKVTVVVKASDVMIAVD
jgi:molybdopterin-binding protein